MGIKSCNKIQDVIVGSQYRYFCQNQVISTADRYRSQVFLRKYTTWDKKVLPVTCSHGTGIVIWKYRSLPPTILTVSIILTLCLGPGSIGWHILLWQFRGRWGFQLFKHEYFRYSLQLLPYFKGQLVQSMTVRKDCMSPENSNWKLTQTLSDTWYNGLLASWCTVSTRWHWVFAATSNWTTLVM